MSSTGTTSDRPDRVDGRRRARWVGRIAAVFAVAVLAGAGTLPGEGSVASASAETAYWPGHDVARRVVSNPAGPGGWTLSAFGAVSAFGGAPALSGAPNWGRWGIARDLVVTSSGTGGYVLDGWGGIHRLGDAPVLSGAPYWTGFDIARRLVLNPAGAGGWVLDGWGSIHAFGGAPRLSGGPYWRGWDIARDLVVTSSGTGGYVLDGFGGIHPVGDAAAVSGTPYWRGWDIARKLILNPDGPGGWLLDGFGGVHRFDGAPVIPGTPYWRGWDIARDLAIGSAGSDAYVLDGWGGLHHTTLAVAPANTDRPVISGTATDGQTLSTTDGTWSGTTPITFVHQWERCDDDDLVGCVGIVGATASTYTPTGDDIDKWVRVRVTAVNPVGVTHAWSAPAGPVAAAAPVNTARPGISPDVTTVAVDGTELTAYPGTWSGSTPMTFSYQWQACDDDRGTNCTDIAGAIDSAYTLTSEEVADRVRVVVIASNAAGDASAPSDVSALVGPVAPANIDLPVVSGTLTDGETLSVSDGTWSGTEPIALSYEWLRCDDDQGNGCQPIPGRRSHGLSPSDIGRYVRVRVTATNDAGSATSSSGFVGPVVGVAPSSTTAPAIAGVTTDGEELSAVMGTWAGSPVVSYDYQWLACTDALDLGTCSSISGATGTTYTLTSAEVGSHIRVAISANNSGGSGYSVSPATAAVAATAPENTAAPGIVPDVTAVAVDGSELTAFPGTWSGSTPMTYSYQWQRCTVYEDPGTCVDIAGEAAAGYTLTSDDVGRFVRVEVTAVNSAAPGGVVAFSGLSTQVGAAAPANTAWPVLSGTAVDGQTLSISDGTWSGTAPFTFAYLWQRCDDDVEGLNCVDVGTDANTYTLTSADVGRYLLAQVTATNAAGSSMRWRFSAQVAAAPPVNTAAPVISGVARDGKTVSVGNGTWTGSAPITFSYQWQRCADNAGAADLGTCADIAGKTSSTYTLTPADVTRHVRAVVTAHNSGDDVAQASDPIGQILAVAPVYTVAPAVSGVAADGEILSASKGTWIGLGPITYSYRWQRCADDAGSADLGTCADIAGQTGSTYTLTGDDVGEHVRAVVTAHNFGNDVDGPTGTVGPVAAAAPVNTALPAISGTATDGQTLSATDGTWSGTPTITFAYQWQVCDDDQGNGCADISGATSSTYTLTSSEVGKYVRVKVTATNVADSASAHSALTAAVAAAPPVNTSAPTLSGTATEGQTLSATDGTWTGTPTITYSYQWESCADDQAVTCGDIVGATSSTYTLTMTEINQYVRVKVTATNSAGTASAYSALTTAVAAAPPVNTSAPTLSGTATDGEILSATAGAWTGAGPITYAYQWEACDDDQGGGCIDISGAIGLAYELTSSEVGKYVRVKVTATNPSGSTDAYSALTTAVAAAPPVNTAVPVVSGTATDGQTLSATDGTWSGTPTITYTYQWEACDDDQGNTCSDILGATSSTYTLTSAQIGKYVRVKVTATNSAGSAGTYSALTAQVAAAPPVNIVAPEAIGTTQSGYTLVATPGAWSGTTPMSFEYTWWRCTGNWDSSCVVMPGHPTTYDLTSWDAGKYLRLIVTATNSAGWATAFSDVFYGPIAG